MFTLYKLQTALRKTTVRAALLVLTLSLAVLLGLRAEVAQDPTPILRTQDIAQITALPAKRAQLDYLLIAAPQSDAPRYVFKLKNDNKLYVVKVPGTTHLSLEREVLLRNNLPYAIARDDYLAAHKAVMQDDDVSLLARAGAFVVRHLLDILLVILALFLLKNGMPGMGVNATVLTPDQLGGSMDDLIGMEDIKQEVLHLEDMIRNRALYKEHDIDKPFNVMLTGPAGTGKTKLAGYLAKRLDIPLIQASGSALESGYIGGGSKALHALHRKACARGKCIIFLDEAQGLFMPRGRGERNGRTTPPTRCWACSTA
ncbi:26S protease regulatory subunit, putative, partial [Ricinus communis]